ncbi:zinc-ribbon domain-containing protein [bacterium]|nr:zinc-ribbon domain-containing protein [bacterium]
MADDKFCQYCGSTLPPGVAFCPNCGSPVAKTPTESPPSPSPVQPMAPTTPYVPSPGLQPYIPPPQFTAPPGGPLPEQKMEIPVVNTVGEAVNLYLSNFFAIFIPFLIAAIITRVLISVITGGIIAFGAGIPALWPLAFLVSIIGIVISILVNGIVGGIVIHEASEAYLGRKSNISGFSVARERMGDLFMGSIIYALYVFFGLILLIIPGLYFAAKYALWQPSVILEADSGNGIGRSSELTTNNRWEIFWIIVIVFIIQAVVSSLGFTSGLGIGGLVVQAVLDALVAPLLTITATVVYYKTQGR